MPIYEAEPVEKKLADAIRLALDQAEEDCEEAFWRPYIDRALDTLGLEVDEPRQEQWANSAFPGGVGGPLVILTNGLAVWERPNKALEVDKFIEPSPTTKEST